MRLNRILAPETGLQVTLGAPCLVPRLANAQVDRTAHALQKRQSFGSQVAPLRYVLKRANVLVEISAHLLVEERCSGGPFRRCVGNGSRDG